MKERFFIMTNEEKREKLKDISGEEFHQMILKMLKTTKRKPYIDSSNKDRNYTSITSLNILNKIKQDIMSEDDRYKGLKNKNTLFYNEIIDNYRNQKEIDKNIIEKYSSLLKQDNIRNTYDSVFFDIKFELEEIKEELGYKKLNNCIVYLYILYLENNPKWKKLVFEKLYIL